jgi:DNA-binding FadR family transcriptional regulator
MTSMRQPQKDLERVLQYLQAADFAQTQRLPPERALAEQLGITRNRLRGSLKKLATEGLIWRHVGKGTFFGRRPSSVNAGALFELTNPREVMEVRLALEPEIATLAAFRANGRDIAEMQTCLDKMIAADDWNDWGFWDSRFHWAIANAAGNALMLLLFETMQASRGKAVWGRLGESSRRSERKREIANEHAAILEAIKQRDPEQAASQMRDHLRSTRRAVFGDVN